MSKELMVLPGIRLMANLSIDITLPSGRQLHVSDYDTITATVTGVDGIEEAKSNICQRVEETLSVLLFGAGGRG